MKHHGKQVAWNSWNWNWDFKFAVDPSKFETKSNKNQVIILAVCATFPNRYMLFPEMIALHYVTVVVPVLQRSVVISFLKSCLHISTTYSNILIYIQQDATLHTLFISGKCSTCFGWYHHPLSGAHTTVSTASGICHTVITICRYRGRFRTGLSVLWVAYATHSTLKPVPTLPR